MKDFASFEKEFLSNTPDAKWSELLSLRATEFARLDRQRQAYLDYTGSNLYPASLISGFQKRLLENVYGNPHSENPTANLSSLVIEETRHRVLEYFNAKKDYCCVFTANATASLKLVGESYPFNEKGAYVYTHDNHNSVLGLRQYAIDKSSTIEAIYLNSNYCFSRQELESTLQKYPSNQQHGHRLFAFPAQSNSTGIKHSLDLIELAHENGWDVLLDAAAYVGTNKLDLQQYQPEFVSISFYKMFGFPTGVGCLLIKTKKEDFQISSAFSKLRTNKPAFFGGTVAYVSSNSQPIRFENQALNHRPLNAILQYDHQAFEEGTPDFLSLPAVIDGLNFLEKISLSIIQQRIGALMNVLIHQLLQLQHKNGQPFAEICGGNERNDRGSNILIKFKRNCGIQYWGGTLEKILSEYNNAPGEHYKVSVRIGTFCNPGVNESCSMDQEDETSEIFHVRVREEVALMEEGNGFQQNDHLTILRRKASDPGYEKYHREKHTEMKQNANRHGYMSGGMRVSIGIATTPRDIYEFLSFAKYILEKYPD